MSILISIRQIIAGVPAASHFNPSVIKSQRVSDYILLQIKLYQK